MAGTQSVMTSEPLTFSREAGLGDRSNSSENGQPNSVQPSEGMQVFSLMWLGVYYPLQRQLEKRLVMPLRVGKQVIIVSPRQPAEAVKRGDWVAYRINEAAGDHVYVPSGFGFGQVQAVAGDRVIFTPQSCQVNDRVLPRRTHMPVQETWVVPEKHWFIWPDSTISI